MIEFGAGGQITHNESETNATGAEGAGAEGTAGDGNAEGAATAPAAEGAPPVPVAAPPNPRRKRKAKGWFCPVCRQRTYPLPSTFLTA